MAAGGAGAVGDAFWVRELVRPERLNRDKPLAFTQAEVLAPFIKNRKLSDIQHEVRALVMRLITPPPGFHRRPADTWIGACFDDNLGDRWNSKYVAGLTHIAKVYYSRSKNYAADVEHDLITYLGDSRCANRQSGGVGLADGGSYCVYVAWRWCRDPCPFPAAHPAPPVVEAPVAAGEAVAHVKGEAGADASGAAAADSVQCARCAKRKCHAYKDIDGKLCDTEVDRKFCGRHTSWDGRRVNC